MTSAIYSGCVLVSYLCGSVPTGFLWGKARGIDIRAVGSGNIGATNVMRTLGAGAGITVLLIDALKGFLPVFIAPRLFPQIDQPTYLSIACCLGAIAGHNWTCWLKFKGGKGIATSAGAVLAFLPIPLGCALAAWVVVFALSRYVSLASMAAAVMLPLATRWFNPDPALLSFTVLLAIVAVWKHRSNIQRLLAGTENRVQKKP